MSDSNVHHDHELTVKSPQDWAITAPEPISPSNTPPEGEIVPQPRPRALLIAGIDPAEPGGDQTVTATIKDGRVYVDDVPPPTDLDPSQPGVFHSEADAWRSPGRTRAEPLRINEVVEDMYLDTQAQKEAELQGSKLSLGTLPPAYVPRHRWAFGMITCSERIDSGLTLQTLRSVHAGGFDLKKLTLFVDKSEKGKIRAFNGSDNLESILFRSKIGAWGNWYLGLQELMIRHHDCAYYAMFQDDFVMCKNTLKYIEACLHKIPTMSYLNLFSFLNSQWEVEHVRGVWKKGAYMVDRPQQSQQCGRGALAYVFPRDAVVGLLSSKAVVMKSISVTNPTKNIDGAVVDGLNAAGWTEYVHGPSLVWHTGVQSVVRPDKVWENNADTFPGEEYDAMKFTEKS